MLTDDLEPGGSPQLKPVEVGRTPSPEHVYVPSDDDSSGEEEAHGEANRPKGARRRSRSYRQRAHGNAVLVGFLTGWNDPHLTNDVCDNPIEAEIQPHEAGDARGKLPALQSSRGDPSDRRDPQRREGRQGRSELQQVGTLSPLRLQSPGLENQDNVREGPQKPERRPGRVSRYSGDAHRGSRDDDPNTLSDPLRQQMITVEVGSPMDTSTLPAMQTSPTNAKRSPTSPPQLPSLASHLAETGALPPLSSVPVTLPGRPARPPNPTLPSPASDFGTPRSGPYSAGARSTYWRPVYPPSEPSPSSAAGGPSPHEPFASPHGSVVGMSPTSRFSGPGPLSPDGSTPGAPPPLSNTSLPPMQQGPADVQTPLSASTQVQTPLSAQTQTSLTTLSSEPSPVAERIPSGDDGERPAFPSSSSGQAAGGGGQYRCDHAGCNAAPFQTQYLLK